MILSDVGEIGQEAQTTEGWGGGQEGGEASLIFECFGPYFHRLKFSHKLFRFFLLYFS